MTTKQSLLSLACAATIASTAFVGAVATAASADPVASSPSSAVRTIHARILNVTTDGMQVHERGGKTDTIVFHQSTITDPPDVTLSPGTIVAVTGYDDGNTFVAKDIAVPSAVTKGAPSSSMELNPGSPYDL